MKTKKPKKPVLNVGKMKQHGQQAMPKNNMMAPLNEYTRPRKGGPTGMRGKRKM